MKHVLAGVLIGLFSMGVFASGIDPLGKMKQKEVKRAVRVTTNTVVTSNRSGYWSIQPHAQIYVDTEGLTSNFNDWVVPQYIIFNIGAYITKGVSVHMSSTDGSEVTTNVQVRNYR